MVDDQSFNLNALEIILKRMAGLETSKMCDFVLSGEKALKLVRQNVEANKGQRCDYTLILMDCNMPKMDGYETTELIRKYIHSQGLKQPVISAVTGHTEPMYIQMAINSGMNQVLSKPVSHDLLIDIVDRLGYN